MLNEKVEYKRGMPRTEINLESKIYGVCKITAVTLYEIYACTTRTHYTSVA